MVKAEDEKAKKESILVVEDEEIMRDSLVDWFSGEGHSVDAAGDGEEALVRFKVEDYDALIIDLKLPGRDGLQVLVDVKKRNPGARVVIVTAYPSYETAVEAMRRGAVDYLPKPFDLERLTSSLRWSPEADVATAPAIEEPLIEQENVTPCIWAQAEITPKRMCTLGYHCNAGCDYHASMMKQEKRKNDPRIQPFLEKLDRMVGTHQCRYIMTGQISSRSCPSLFHCDDCEFSQMFHDQVDRQFEIRDENKRRKKAARTRVVGGNRLVNGPSGERRWPSR
jgi:CheY-like chemotaxis protein